MRKNHVPKIGDLKFVQKFAWMPKKIWPQFKEKAGTEDLIWLKTYYAVYEWKNITWGCRPPYLDWSWSGYIIQLHENPRPKKMTYAEHMEFILSEENKNPAITGKCSKEELTNHINATTAILSHSPDQPTTGTP